MKTARGVVPLVLFSMLVLTSCVTETRETGALSWTERAAAEPGGAEPARAPRREPAEPGRTLEIPEELMAELMGFVNRTQFFIADRIDVDASRIPFQMAMVPLADPVYVEKVHLGSPSANATGLLLRSMNPRPMVDRDFPRLRVGDGIDLVATREIQVRTYNSVDERRPVFFALRGVGNAVYRDPRSNRRVARDSLTLVAEIVPGPDGLVFRERIQ